MKVAIIRYVPLVFFFITIAGCSLFSSKNDDSIDFNDPKWRPAYLSIMEVLDKYVDNGSINASPTSRCWSDDVTTRDFSFSDVPSPELLQKIEVEILNLLKYRLSPEDFAIILNELQDPPEEFLAKNLNGCVTASIPGMNGVTLVVRSYADLAFWHNYEVEWTVVANPTMSATQFYAKDMNISDYCVWKTDGGDMTIVTYYNANSPRPNPLHSKWIAGARDIYHGFSEFSISFYDSRITGGSFTWTPQIPNLSK